MLTAQLLVPQAQEDLIHEVQAKSSTLNAPTTSTAGKSAARVRATRSSSTYPGAGLSIHPENSLCSNETVRILEHLLYLYAPVVRGY